jgi:DNA polymerase-3 subunit delta'
MSDEALAPEQADSLPGIPSPAENPLLFGHETVEARLAESYRAGRLHHALLLAGPQGIGKATLAFRLARHVLVHPEPADAPADRLSMVEAGGALFRQIVAGGHPSVLHLTRSRHERTGAFRSAITVDEVRRIARFTGLTAHDGSWRVAIIDPADDMNANAANALLKTLEEPPRRTLFILIAHNPGGLLPTIRSRCELVRLQPLADAPLGAALSQVAGLDRIDHTLFRVAGGSVREAILMARHGGAGIAETIETLLDAPRFDFQRAAALAEEVAARGSDVAFDLFNRLFLQALAGRARIAAEAGGAREGARLAGLWQEFAGRMRESGIYNLDRRQHVIGRLREAHAAIRSPAAGLAMSG